MFLPSIREPGLRRDLVDELLPRETSLPDYPEDPCDDCGCLRGSVFCDCNKDLTQ